MKKKIVVFTGAGISKESGVDTFRDAVDGLWENHKIEEVCTLDGWRKDREKVLNFYNDRRKQMPTVEPNDAHKALVRLEELFDVTIVTQNVDDLHERGGSTNIIHLHGELTKARGSMYQHKPSPIDEVYDIGYGDINIGDKCKVTGSQLRPHIVWFGEFPFRTDEAYDAVYNADILIIVGTSLQISYTLDMLNNVKRVPEQAKIIYIDPKPMRYLNNYGLSVEYVEKGAVEGVTEIVERIINEQK
jgi:NAD-dependent deacetylase